MPLIGMRSPIFQPKRLAVVSPTMHALAVLQERVPLVVADQELRKHLALGAWIDDQLREEVPFVLIDASEPVGEGHGVHPGNLRGSGRGRRGAGAG